MTKPLRKDDGLNLLCDGLEQGAVSSCEKQYVAGLRDSRITLGSGQPKVLLMTDELEGDPRDIVLQYHRDCQEHVQAIASVLERTSLNLAMN